MRGLGDKKYFVS